MLSASLGECFSREPAGKSLIAARRSTKEGESHAVDHRRDTADLVGHRTHIRYHHQRFIHILVVLAIIVVVIRLIQGRRVL